MACQKARAGSWIVRGADARCIAAQLRCRRHGCWTHSTRETLWRAHRPAWTRTTTPCTTWSRWQGQHGKCSLKILEFVWRFVLRIKPKGSQMKRQWRERLQASMKSKNLGVCLSMFISDFLFVCFVFSVKDEESGGDAASASILRQLPGVWVVDGGQGERPEHPQHWCRQPGSRSG